MLMLIEYVHEVGVIELRSKTREYKPKGLPRVKKSPINFPCTLRRFINQALHQLSPNERGRCLLCLVEW